MPKNKNGAFNSSPIHLPSISSPLSRFIPASQTDNQNETPPSCFIHPPSVFYSFTGASLPLQWLLSFFPPLSLSFCLVCSSCIKKAILSCFSASVSLSVYVHLAGFPVVWLQVASGVTQWATSSSGFSGVKPFPSLCADLTGGVLYCCLFPLTLSVSLCVFVALMSFPSVYPPAKV